MRFFVTVGFLNLTLSRLGGEDPMEKEKRRFNFMDIYIKNPQRKREPRLNAAYTVILFMDDRRITMRIRYTFRLPLTWALWGLMLLT